MRLGKLLLVTAAAANEGNYKCKNASSDWPLPCAAPVRTQLPKMRIAKQLPISAWWGPVGYGGPDSTSEWKAYVAAGFNNVQVSDRGPQRCAGPLAAAQSWSFIKRNIANAAAANMTVLLDTYRCVPWGDGSAPRENEGGDAQGPVGAFVANASNHKITLPEVQWLAGAVRNMTNVVGLLVTDDGVDLAANEVAECEWMAEHTPELLAWVNQCGDGSEWLARAKTPYAVPELYAVNPGARAGNATAVQEQCAAQLAGYEAWAAKGARFGLAQFPLVNIGDGGDTGLVRSSSLVRFQGYAALAYGAKGLMWYCWGRGAWNLTAGAPTAIYGTLAEVNHRVNGWSDALLAFPRFEGAFHTGWAAPSKSARSPGRGALVEAMDDALLVGVLGLDDTSGSGGGVHGGSDGDTASLLLVVVDKRVSGLLPAAAVRTVSITLAASVASVEVVGDGRGPVPSLGARRSAAVSLSLSLAGGDAALLKLTGGAAMQALARALPQWRYSRSAPDLGAVQTTQYSYYGWGEDRRAQTRFVIGAEDFGTAAAGGGAEQSVGALAALGFNTLLAPLDGADASSLYGTLNAALRKGLFVLAAPPPGADWTASALASALERHGCHPNFAGVSLGAPLDLATAASAKQLAALVPVVSRLRQLAPHALSLLAGRGTASELAAAAVASTAPLVALALGSGGDFGGTAAALGEAWQQPDLASLLVRAHVCNATAAAARFQAYAALLLGAKGLVQVGCGAAGSGDHNGGAVAGINADVAHWGNALLGMTTVSVHATTTFAVPGATPLPANGTAGTGAVVASMGDNLLLGVLERSGSSAAASPPMLLVVDARPSGKPRDALLGLGPHVVGWTPLVGDSPAGFGNCAKLVLGRTARVSLAPGQGMLLALTMHQPQQQQAQRGPAPSEEARLAQLWSLGRRAPKTAQA